MGGIMSTEEEEEGLPPPPFPPPGTAIDMELGGSEEPTENTEHIARDTCNVNSTTPSKMPTDLHSLQELVRTQEREIRALQKDVRRAGAGGGSSPLEVRPLNGDAVTRPVCCLSCGTKGRCVVSQDLAKAPCRVHTGAFQVEKKCSEFLALEEPLKEMLRQQKAKRLLAVEEEMRWILASDSDSFGQWSCCPDTPGLQHQIPGCSPQTGGGPCRHKLRFQQ
eukprot:gb/GEZN01016268.1/.p1 GENE.gb/GEZN01016268.1/~~gb/GEZN01016268.1/.p1  ORF type:complete len:221 (+),score=19.47 gb/GEZN01016268.1/:188-850(+)